MISVGIPGYREFKFENVVFDYNGTLAVDGRIDEYTRQKLIELSSITNVHILTADTHGSVKKQCEGLGAIIMTFPNNEAAKHKRVIVENLKGEKICVGNGFNDIGMCDIADLSVAVVGEEGCSGKLISCCDIVVQSREDLFNLFFNIDRIKATLRR